MRKIKMMMILLIGLPLVASCAEYGPFCDVAQGPIQFENPDSVPLLLDLGERPALEKIDANNRTGERQCDWELT